MKITNENDNEQDLGIIQMNSKKVNGKFVESFWWGEKKKKKKKKDAINNWCKQTDSLREL